MTSTTAEHQPGRIVVVDDDRRAASAQARWLCDRGWHARAAGSLAEAERALARARCDVCLVDGGLEGVARFVATLATRSPATATVVVGAPHGAPAAANGADAIVAPGAADATLLAAIDAARRTAATRDRVPVVGPLGADAGVVAAFATATRIAGSDATVLITGESGTGKSLLARSLHAASPRASRPLVEVSCGSLAEPLLDSELFGHVAGSFTGAHADRPGRFVEADGGTIFLDEIATASPALQVRLLRVLQERRLEPVGSGRTRSVDVRVVLATHEDLPALVAAGRFREDLYWRINVITIELPPLRDRGADVLLLAESFRTAACRRHGRMVEGFTQAARTALEHHRWPGNVRELEHAIHRAVLLGTGSLIDVADLPPAVVAAPPRAAVLKQALADPERRLILDALRAQGWRRDAAARQLGINRTALYKKLKRLGIDPRSLPSTGTAAAGAAITEDPLSIRPVATSTASPAASASR